MLWSRIGDHDSWAWKLLCSCHLLHKTTSVTHRQATGLKLGAGSMKVQASWDHQEDLLFPEKLTGSPGVCPALRTVYWFWKPTGMAFAFFEEEKFIKWLRRHIFSLIFPHIRCASRYISRFIHGFKKQLINKKNKNKNNYERELGLLIILISPKHRVCGHRILASLSTMRLYHPLLSHEDQGRVENRVIFSRSLNESALERD